MEKIIFFVFLLFFPIKSLAVIPIQNNFNQPLKQVIEYYHEETGELDIQQIKNKEFDMKDVGGFYSGNVWGRAEICNQQNQKIHFIYKDPIDDIKIYVGDSRVAITNKLTNKSDLSKSYWVDLELPIKGCKTIWIMFQSGDVLSFSSYLVSEKNLKKMISNYNLFYGAYYSILCLIFMISLALLFKYKEKACFYLCCVLITQDFLGTSLLNGFLFYYALPTAYFFQYDVGNIFAPLMNISIIAFTISFLKEKNKFNTIVSKLFIISQTIIVSPLLLNIFVNFHHQNPIVSQLVNQSILFAFGWAFYLGIFNFRTYRGKIFVFASGFKIGGQILKTLLLQGDISENINLFSVKLDFLIFNISAVGSLCEAVLIIFFLIDAYIKNIERSKLELKEALIKTKDAEMVKALMNISRQLAHDIRSPLLALEYASKEIKGVSEEKRLIIKNATNRIADIANKLLIKTKSTDLTISDPVFVCFIYGLIEKIIYEKKTKFLDRTDVNINFTIHNKSYFLAAKINPSDFKRVLSNLIDNSVEAIKNEPLNILIELKTDYKGNLIVSVSDNGRGMPSYIVDMLGEVGVSSGKENYADSGYGLGLSHAFSIIKSWGGFIDIYSKENIGTEISLYMPLSDLPDWFEKKITITNNSIVIILDNGKFIHDLWEDKLEHLPIKLFHLTDPEFLSDLVNENLNEEIFILCDYEFSGFKLNGIDLIKNLNLEKNAILVSNRLDEINIQNDCSKIHLKGIPKELVSNIEVEVVNTKRVYDAILIDDDILVHRVWKVSSEMNNKSVVTFYSPRNFLENMHKLSTDIPIFLDYEFDDCKGVEYLKDIYEAGFIKIYLCTGFDKSEFKNNKYLVGVRGKEPCWDCT